jgi:lipid II:glycine glycyltransferase (peptidoglycan interpeptide bridge formation enzyme)
MKIMINKEKYRLLCEKETSIPIFSRAWWLDAVAGDSWDVVLVEKGGEIHASLPFIRDKRLGLIISSQPQLTQNLGPWIMPHETSSSKSLAIEKELMQGLINQLPKFSYFKQNWHYNNKNWLPFYWNDYLQTTCYTYVIEDLSNLVEVFSNFDHAKRKNIKKAEKIVKVVFDIAPDIFYENHEMTLKKQGSKIFYSYDLFKKIYDSCYANNSGRTIAAYDAEGNLHGALFVIWDDMSAYDLISTIDPEYRNSGSASLLIKEVITYVSDFVNKFDFEGSMIEPVERSFRQFGAKQTPYFRVSKTNSKLLKVHSLFQDLIK